MHLPEIKKNLEELPSKIAYQATIVEKARLELAVAEQRLKEAEAVSFIKNKHADIKKAMPHVNAEVVLDTKTEANNVILAEGKFKSEMIKLNSLEAGFLAVRKIASILEIEAKAGI